MTRVWTLLVALLAVATLAAQAPPTAKAPAPGPIVTVTARNPLSIARTSETIVLQAAALKKGLAVDDIRRVRVRAAGAAPEVLAQAVDLDDDGVFDELVFQADFGPRETKRFELAAGEIRVYTREQFKAYGRFVRERRDDFAWENDRIAHRMYGTALETWKAEPLTSSGVDVWMKRTRRLVINDWYMVDDYHRDNGEGADFYSAGKSRGCGGSGLWTGGKLYTSANFRDSRVIANGPIRVMFELTYLPWDVGGTQVSEVKRVTLDAGQNMDRFESFYKGAAGRALVHAAGIKKAAGSKMTWDKASGSMVTSEQIKAAGDLWCAVVMNPALVTEVVQEADGNYLMAARAPAGGPAVHYAGFSWPKAGDFANEGQWAEHVKQFSARVRSPVTVTLSAR